MGFLSLRIQSLGPKSKTGSNRIGILRQGGRDLDQREDPVRELAEIHDSLARNYLEESPHKDKMGRQLQSELMGMSPNKGGSPKQLTKKAALSPLKKQHRPAFAV